MKSHQLINQTSGEVEYYTPAPIIEAARGTMGGIDLDPASSERANKIVRAKSFFTKDDNSLQRPWAGRVWMNHPFHAGWKACVRGCKRKTCRTRGHIYEDIPGNAAWINKLVLEYENGGVTQACCITYASTSEAWFQPLLNYPQCFLHGRTNYLLPSGEVLKGVSKGSVVTYFGQRVDEFHRYFRGLGTVKIPFLL